MHHPARLDSASSQPWAALRTRLESRRDWHAEARAELRRRRNGTLDSRARVEASGVCEFPAFLLGLGKFTRRRGGEIGAVLSHLERLGLAASSGGRSQTLGVRLLPLSRGWIVVPVPWRDDARRPWTRLNYGEDTHILLSALSKIPVDGKAVLDVGTGPGTLAIDCAARGARAVALDVDVKALQATQMNAILAGVEAEVEAFHGEVGRLPARRAFDLVVCNPPFLPLLPGGRLPPTAAGGPDGFEMIRGLIANLRRIMAPGGRCLILCRIDSKGLRPTNREILRPLRSVDRGFAADFLIHESRARVEDIFYLVAKQFPERRKSTAFEAVLAADSWHGQGWAHYGLLTISR